MADNEIQTPPDSAIQTVPVAPTATKKTARSKGATQKSRAGVSDTVKQKSRGLSEQEKQLKVSQVDGLLSGGMTLKDAVKSAGISDQTYYVWKKTLAPTDSVTAPTSIPEDDEFAEFIQLEEENRRLRKLLSEKLRAENADLRKRLGLK